MSFNPCRRTGGAGMLALHGPRNRGPLGREDPPEGRRVFWTPAGSGKSIISIPRPPFVPHFPHSQRAERGGRIMLFPGQEIRSGIGEISGE